MRSLPRQLLMMVRRRGTLFGLISACALASACSSGSSVSCPSPGGLVAGAKDSHCAKAQPTSPVSCHPQEDGGTSDGGMEPADGGAMDNSYGPTLYNAEGDDDDCKYHVKWTASTICRNAD